MIKLLPILTEIRIRTELQQYLEEKGYDPNQTEFPKGLDLSGTGIKSIPLHLKISKFLNLKGTKITSIPNGMKIYGNLILDNTPITRLPEHLKIRGSLYLNNVKLDFMVSNGVQVGYRVFTNNHLNMWFLPNDLRRKAKV